MNVTTQSLDESTGTTRPPTRRRFVATIVAAGIVILVAGLVVGLDLLLYVPRESRPIALSADPELTKRAVLHQIPIGCNMWLARDVMEMNGFTCRMMYGQSFYTSRPNGSQIQDFANENYWQCIKTEPVVVGISDLKYQVAIPIKKGVVSGVYVSIDEIVTSSAYRSDDIRLRACLARQAG